MTYFTKIRCSTYSDNITLLYILSQNLSVCKNAWVTKRLVSKIFASVWNTYGCWGGPRCMSHWMTRIFHWIANEIGPPRAANELSSCDTHLNPSSAHHAMRWDHCCHLCRTSLSIKIISPSVLAVHLGFCVRISCWSASRKQNKRKRNYFCCSFSWGKYYNSRNVSQ